MCKVVSYYDRNRIVHRGTLSSTYLAYVAACCHLGPQTIASMTQGKC